MDLAGYLAVLRRRFPALLLCLLIGGAGGYYKGHHAQPVYQATSRSLVTQPPGISLESQLTAAQLSGQFLQTYAQVATSRSVAQKVVNVLHLPTSAAAVQGQLTSQLETGTYIIDVSAVASDAALAQSLANTAAAALADRVAELEAGKPSPVKAQLLDAAVLPGVPISPKPHSDQLLGLLLGLVVGLSLVAATEALDRTIKTSEQGEAAFGAPLLALIPRRKARSAALVLSGSDNGPEGEPYRALRTAVQFTDPDVTMRTILVTSASPGDGKTTTTSNLALALAASGENVVVVDADLRRATLAGVFGLEQAVGLSSLVLRTVDLDDTLQQWAERVTVLPSGRPLPPNPSELLGSHFMSQLLEELAQRFDVVLVDTPPVLPVTDAVALATQVDGVLIVARHGQTQRGPAAEARRRLDAVGAHVIGYVLNAVPARESAGYYADYRYEYSAPGRKRKATPEASGDTTGRT
jgi:capsular exopolysaccharide synthesis family protein